MTAFVDLFEPALQFPPDRSHPAIGAGDIVAFAVLLTAGLTTWLLAHVLGPRRRSRRVVAPVQDEFVARAAMEDLCSEGWQAQITLYGWGAPVPSDAPPARRPLVSIDYTEYGSRATHEVAVVRRIWAESIPAALEAMVQSRRTDATLEEIERAASDEGDRWR
ncbi:MAG: hypothetical protein ACR2HD_11645 [Solirubrobacteraceae bacterium]|nr:MAG: hypothetical protein DLM63_09630 [Solirubrobacterales bacterium]